MIEDEGSICAVEECYFTALTINILHEYNKCDYITIKTTQL